MMGREAKVTYEKGEVTVYLSLVFILLISFVGAMIESASIQTAKNCRRADTDRAIESVFAEYQKELMKEYDVFALEASYETGQYHERQIKERLSYYGADNIEHNIDRIQFLTDQNGQPFYEQVEAYMKHKMGVAAMEDKLGTSSLWTQQERDAQKYTEQQKEDRDKLSGLLDEHETQLPDEGNPLPHIEQIKSYPLLSLVLPKDYQLSEKAVEPDTLPSGRSLNHGYGDFSDVEKSTGRISKLFYGEYVLEHFENAGSSSKTGALCYETEYILAGKSSDKENLTAVAEKLMLLRFVPNYLYLKGDAQLRGEAEALAFTLCSVLAVPAVTEAVTQVLLIAWAFGECMMDIRSLLKGNRVPAIKSRDSWQLQLSSLSKLGTGEDTSEGKDTEGGLTYKEYLRILLFLADQDRAGIRTLDMIEQNLRVAKGLAFFKADQCVSRMEISSTCRLRRGISYRFRTYFGYR